MTKTELIDKLYQKSGGKITKRVVAEMVDGVFDNVAGVIKKEGRFSYPGFGTFVVRKRKARLGRNPRTGGPIKIKASKSVGFRTSKALKEQL